MGNIQVDKEFNSCQQLPYMCPYSPWMVYVISIITHCFNVHLVCQEDATLVVPFLRDDNHVMNTEILLAIPQRQQGAIALSVHHDDAIWHTPFYQVVAHCLWLVISFSPVSTNDKLPELPVFVEFCCRIDTCQVKRTWSFTVSCLWVSAEQQGCLHSGNVIDVTERPSFCIPVNTDVAQCDNDDKYSKDSDRGIKYLSSSFHLIMYLLNHYE